MGYGSIQGIPMIASSPVRHDSPLNLHGLEVTSYQPPWKALSDFALHADLDNNGAVNHTPAFQHLVNQASHHHFSYPQASPAIRGISFPLCRAHSAVLLGLLFICVSLRTFFCLVFFPRLVRLFNIFLLRLKSAKLFLQIKKDGQRRDALGDILITRETFLLLLSPTDARLRHGHGHAARATATVCRTAADGAQLAPPSGQHRLIRNLPGERREHTGIALMKGSAHRCTAPSLCSNSRLTLIYFNVVFSILSDESVNVPFMCWDSVQKAPHFWRRK